MGAYHFMACLGSFELMTIVGLIGLLIGGSSTSRCGLRRLGTSMYVMLIAAIALGSLATVSTQVFGGAHIYNYRETISP